MPCSESFDKGFFFIGSSSTGTCEYRASVLLICEPKVCIERRLTYHTVNIVTNGYLWHEHTLMHRQIRTATDICSIKICMCRNILKRRMCFPHLPFVTTVNKSGMWKSTSFCRITQHGKCVANLTSHSLSHVLEKTMRSKASHSAPDVSHATASSFSSHFIRSTEGTAMSRGARTRAILSAPCCARTIKRLRDAFKSALCGGFT